MAAYALRSAATVPSWNAWGDCAISVGSVLKLSFVPTASYKLSSEI